MAFHRIPFYTGAGPDGAPQHPSDLLRQVLSNSGNGVGDAFALQPQALNPSATNQIKLASGLAVVQGKAQVFQGGYADFNTGDLFVTMPANNSGGIRYDMVVVRVEDPDFEGNRDRSSDEIIFTETITNVSSSARTLADAGKPGYTAIPIAVVTRGTSGTITQGDINDVRRLARPNTHSFFDVLNTPDNLIGSQQLTESEGWQHFPDYASWTVEVPEWAVEADISILHSGLRLDGQDFSDHSAFGLLAVEVNGNRIGTSAIWFNKTWSWDFTEFTHGAGCTLHADVVLPLAGFTTTVKPLAVMVGHSGSTLPNLSYARLASFFTLNFREKIVTA